MSKPRSLLDRPVEHPERGAAIALRIEEPRSPPVLGFVLAYAAMAPILIGAVAFALVPDTLRSPVLTATLIWSASVVLFLSGVRRGLSFRTPGGATIAQIGTSMGLFAFGLLALLGLGLETPTPSLVLLIAAFACMGVLDPIAARQGETPLYFARLRPLQMTVPVLALLALLWLAAA